MAGLFCTSCNLETVLTSASGPFDVVVGSPSINIGAGPAGNNTVTIPPSTYLLLNMPASASGAGVGVGIAMSSAPSVEVVLATVHTDTQVLFVTVDPNGILRWGIPGSAVLAVSPSGTFKFTGARQYVEFGSTALGGSGNETLRLQYEGTVVATDTGQIPGTKFVAVTYGNRDDTAPFSPSGLMNPYTLDSFYMLDGTGARNNALLGKRVVTPRLSAGPGQYAQFLGFMPGGPVPPWQAIGNIPPMHDSIAADMTPGDQLAVALSNVTGVAAVDFVMRRVSARQDTPGSRGIALGVGDGTTIVYGPTRALTTSYQNLNQVYDQDPISNSPWTLTNLMSRQAAMQTI